MVWAGSFYSRQRGKQVPNWRDRNSGLIVKDKPRIIRRGSRNRAIIVQGNKVLAIEPTGRHFFNSDLTTKNKARIIFSKRVRGDSERKAMFSKLKGRR